MDLEKLQFQSISEMLHLSVEDDSEYPQLKTWKILLYDDEAKRILSPIVKVGELRRMGVTLNMPLKERRDMIQGVDAVYLITPSDENIKIILDDAVEGKYNQIHINFTTYTNDAYLSELAKKFVEHSICTIVSSLTDRYMHFISLSPRTFSLDLKSTFRLFYGDDTSDRGEEVIETVVDRLLSVIVTMGILPIIKTAIIASPAFSVAERLNKRLHDLVKSRNQLGITLSTKSYERPLMVILDRSIDIGSMIQHSWNYQPLLHDVFGINYNKVSITTGSQKRSTFELDSRDRIYREIMSMPLSEVAMHISNSLEAYNSRLVQINKGDSTSTSGLVNAMNAIPQLTEQKRLLDMHTNIATALVDAVKERDLDRFYEFESDIDYMYDKNCLQRFEELMNNEKAKPMDKYRALLLIALSKRSISEGTLDEYERRIKESGAIKIESLKGLRNIIKLKAFSESLLKQMSSGDSGSVGSNITHKKEEGPTISGITGREVSQSHKRLANYSTKIIDTGVSLFKGVRNLLPRKKSLCVANIVEGLINNSETVKNEFASFDPKLSEAKIPNLQKRSNSRLVVVFILGGASYSEAGTMSDLGNKLKQTIVFGSTSFDRPDEFVAQLASSTSEQRTR